ncbi:MAG: Ulp1 family isopeptidase [Promethearchaeota archaeon]
MSTFSSLIQNYGSVDLFSRKERIACLEELLEYVNTLGNHLKFPRDASALIQKRKQLKLSNSKNEMIAFVVSYESLVSHKYITVEGKQVVRLMRSKIVSKLKDLQSKLAQNPRSNLSKVKKRARNSEIEFDSSAFQIVTAFPVSNYHAFVNDLAKLANLDSPAAMSNVTIIDSGNGALAMFLAYQYNIKVLGIPLSDRDLRFSNIMLHKTLTTDWKEEAPNNIDVQAGVWRIAANVLFAPPPLLSKLGTLTCSEWLWISGPFKREWIDTINSSNHIRWIVSTNIKLDEFLDGVSSVDKLEEFLDGVSSVDKRKLRASAWFLYRREVSNSTILKNDCSVLSWTGTDIATEPSPTIQYYLNSRVKQISGIAVYSKWIANVSIGYNLGQNPLDRQGYASSTDPSSDSTNEMQESGSEVEVESSLGKGGPLTRFEDNPVISDTPLNRLEIATLDKIKEWAENNPDKNIVNRERIYISGSDLLTLFPNQWMNDSIINYFIHTRHPNPKTKNVWIFNSYAWVKLMDVDLKGDITRYNFKSMTKWLDKKSNLFGVSFNEVKSKLERILLPVNLEQRHWVLLKLDMEKKKVVLIDSMRTSSATLQQVLLAARQFMVDLYGLEESDIKARTMIGAQVQVDYVSCGMFVIQNILKHGLVDLPSSYQYKGCNILRKRLILEIWEQREDNVKF